MLRLRPTTVVSLSSLLAMAACSAAHDSKTDSNQSASESELRALTPSEIVGTLEYGQTSATVDYTSTPLYRAFRFNGSAGDEVVAWVRSTTGGDARAWLVDASFRNLVSNDNANSATLDAHLATTLRTTGVYYVVLRDKASEDASFNVTLTKAGGDAPCDPEEDTGCAGGVVPPPASAPTFDNDTCGAALKQEELLRRLFQPGMTVANIGTVTLRYRERRCNETTGCTAWQNSTQGDSFSGSAELFLPSWIQGLRLRITGTVDSTWAAGTYSDSGAGVVKGDGTVGQWLTLAVWRSTNGDTEWRQNRFTPSSFEGRLGAQCAYLRGAYAYTDPDNGAQQISQEGLLTIRYPAR